MKVFILYNHLACNPLKMYKSTSTEWPSSYHLSCRWRSPGYLALPVKPCFFSSDLIVLHSTCIYHKCQTPDLGRGLHTGITETVAFFHHLMEIRLSYMAMRHSTLFPGRRKRMPHWKSCLELWKLGHGMHLVF